jgi:solute carrier family 25 protein 33/36
MGALCTTPLEVVKTRLQAQTTRRLLAAGRSEGGWGGRVWRWRALGPSLGGVIPARAVWFSTYAQAKLLLERHAALPPTHPAVHLGAGLCAGLTVTTVTCPIWVVKTRLQLQTRALQGAEGLPPYRSAWDCARVMYRTEGPSAFYKGLFASYLGILESSLQLVLYERLKHSLQLRKWESLHACDPAINPSKSKSSPAC